MIGCETDAIIEVSWDELAEEMKQTEPDLYRILEDINPSEEHRFIKVRYPYGASIIENGILKLPVDGQCLPLMHPDIPNAIRESLNYQVIPLGWLLNKVVDVYREIDDRVFTLASFEPGVDLGIYETFGPATPFSVSAGARSVFLLPKITDLNSHKNLKREFNIRSSVPKNLSEQWQVFVELANHTDFSQPWHCEIAFFTSNWFNHREDKKWLPFYHYLLQKAWYHTAYARERTITEFNWKHFCDLLLAKGLKPSQYLIDTLRQLIFIGAGVLPAFTPVVNQQAGPISGLQQIYMDVYKLKHYVPTMLCPCYFKNTPVYYSLQFPTVISSTPGFKSYTSAADDLRDLRELMDHFIEMATDGRLQIASKKIKKLINTIQYDFFHSDMYTYGGIQSTKVMPDTDSALAKLAPQQQKSMQQQKRQLRFCERASFLRGCVRISLTEKG